MIKKNKGITLIALVITIIVLLILAAVSINAVVGENGIIARAMESRIVTLIADIIFNLEDNIVDIQAENIPKNIKYTATEMMLKLQERDVLEGQDDYFADLSNLLMQSNIKDNRLDGLSLSFNGDVWLDNYKRGKILLSPRTNVLYSTDGKTKITVIDGTAEEITENYKYRLHSLEDRGDFVCWINQFGEIISTYKDTIIFVLNPREEEYTAIYDNDLKRLFESRNYNFEAYKNEWLSDGFADDTEDYEDEYDEGYDIDVEEDNGEESEGDVALPYPDIIAGVQSIAYKDTEGDLWFEIQATHNTIGSFYTTNTVAADNETVLNMGMRVNYLNLYISDNYETLEIMNDDWINSGEILKIPFASFNDDLYLTPEEEGGWGRDDYDPTEDYPWVCYDTDDDVMWPDFESLQQTGQPCRLFSTTGNYVYGERPDNYLYYDKDKGFELGEFGTCYFPEIFNEKNLQYGSKIDFVALNANLEKINWEKDDDGEGLETDEDNEEWLTLLDTIKKLFGNNIKRIYYRVGLDYELLLPEPFTKEEYDIGGLVWDHYDGRPEELGPYEHDKDVMYDVFERDYLDFFEYFEPTIKYVDL